MDWLTTDIIEQLMELPYLIALGGISWIFMKIIMSLIDVIRKRDEDKH